MISKTPLDIRITIVSWEQTHGYRPSKLTTILALAVLLLHMALIMIHVHALIVFSGSLEGELLHPKLRRHIDTCWLEYRGSRRSSPDRCRDIGWPNHTGNATGWSILPTLCFLTYLDAPSYRELIFLSVCPYFTNQMETF